MKSRKMLLMVHIYFQGRNRGTDIENRLRTQRDKERAGWIERAALTYICHHVWDRQRAGSCSTAQGAQLSAPDDWRGGPGDRREALEGGSICIHTDDSVQELGWRRVTFTFHYSWFILLYSRNEQNIVNQLYSN